MGKLVRWIDRKFYPQYADNWDDELLRQKLLKVLRPSSVVLDLGAGSGIVRQMNVRGKVASVCGVDQDESVLRNPFLDEAKVASGESIPYPDGTFDVVFADNVLEHLEEPAAVFREVARVLAPGGLFLAKTPNRRHYMPLIARLTPHSFHQWFNRLRGREEKDTFPTLYRANSRAQIAAAAAAAGMSVRRIAFHEGRPEYLRLFAPAYLCGLVYERLVNSVRALATFRVLIIAVLEKPHEQASRP